MPHPPLPVQKKPTLHAFNKASNTATRACIKELYDVNTLLMLCYVCTGRHDNAWLSPKGCMMFSCPLALRPRSRLLAHLSLLQHIVALSVVTAIRTAPGYEVGL